MENKGADSWTQAQVDRLSGHRIDELLGLWGQVIDPVTTMLTLAPQGSACQLVFDTQLDRILNVADRFLKRIALSVTLRQRWTHCEKSPFVAFNHNGESVLGFLPRLFASL